MSIEPPAAGEAAGTREASWCGDPPEAGSVEGARGTGFSALGAGTFPLSGMAFSAGATVFGMDWTDVTEVPPRSAARFSITSFRVTWLRVWIALITATSKCSFLFGAHFIRPSASANCSINSRRRSVSIKAACLAKRRLQLGVQFVGQRVRFHFEDEQIAQVRNEIGHQLHHVPCPPPTLRRAARALPEVWPRRIFSVNPVTVCSLVKPKTFNTSLSAIFSPQNATS